MTLADRDVRADQIADDEIPYLLKMAEGLEEAARIEQTIQTAQRRVFELRAASDSYIRYLCEKYGYDPSRTIIERNGTFTVRDG